MSKYVPKHRAARNQVSLAKVGVPAVALAATSTMLTASHASATGTNRAAASPAPSGLSATFVATAPAVDVPAAAPAVAAPEAAAPAAAAAAPQTVGVSARVMKINRAVSVANNQIGTRYVYGGMSPRGFDCSGLIAYSFARAGIRLPHQSGAIASKTRRIAKSNMKPGDLMFFSNGGGVYHVGMFVRWTKNGPLMVHSPRPGQRVSKTVPWTSAWFAGTLR